MCCIISGEPLEDSRGKVRTFAGPMQFQTGMMGAPCAGGFTTCLWYSLFLFCDR